MKKVRRSPRIKKVLSKKRCFDCDNEFRAEKHEVICKRCSGISHKKHKGDKYGLFAI